MERNTKSNIIQIQVVQICIYEAGQHGMGEKYNTNSMIVAPTIILTPGIGFSGAFFRIYPEKKQELDSIALHCKYNAT